MASSAANGQRAVAKQAPRPSAPSRAARRTSLRKNDTTLGPAGGWVCRGPRPGGRAFCFGERAFSTPDQRARGARRAAGFAARGPRDRPAPITPRLLTPPHRAPRLRTTGAQCFIPRLICRRRAAACSCVTPWLAYISAAPGRLASARAPGPSARRTQRRGGSAAGHARAPEPCPAPSRPARRRAARGTGHSFPARARPARHSNYTTLVCGFCPARRHSTQSKRRTDTHPTFPHPTTHTHTHTNKTRPSVPSTAVARGRGPWVRRGAARRRAPRHP